MDEYTFAMRTILLAVILVPSLAGAGFEIVPDDSNYPQTDSRIAERMCAFMAHPRLARSSPTASRMPTAAPSISTVRDIKVQDIADLCTSMRAAPAPDANIAITVRDRDGVAHARVRCHAKILLTVSYV